MASLALGVAAALDQVQNIGQLAELGQNHIQHKEQLAWTRRGYTLDSQSLRLDALDHAKEEIKSHYDTYVGRIDTLLLVLALIFPFALNVIQFSDPFIPSTEDECEDCVEAQHPVLVLVWACLIAMILVMPFWGILMLIRCKLKLDSWLEYSLAGLHRERREIVAASDPSHSHSVTSQEQLKADADETEEIVFRLVNIVLEYQEYLARIWTSECGALVRHATSLLWLSATAALLLTSLSMWIFLVNKKGAHEASSYFFMAIIFAGCIVPFVYFFAQRIRGSPRPPVFDHEDMTDEAFPLTAPSVRTFRGPTESRASRDSSGDLEGIAQRRASSDVLRAPSGSSLLNGHDGSNGHDASQAFAPRLFFCQRRRKTRQTSMVSDPLLPKSMDEGRL